MRSGSDVDRGRDMLRRYLKDGTIQCSLDDEGPTQAASPRLTSFLSDFSSRNRRIPGVGRDSRDSQVFARSSGGSLVGFAETDEELLPMHFKAA